MAVRPVVLASLLVAFAMAGCSGDGGASDGGDASRTPSPSASASATASMSTSSSASSSSASSSGSAPAAPRTVEKDIRGNAFPDGTFEVRAGDTVRWTQRDSVPHSVTGDGGAFDSNPLGCPPACMVQGQTFSFTFSEAGSFPYHCKVHPSMTGTVTVTA